MSSKDWLNWMLEELDEKDKRRSGEMAYKNQASYRAWFTRNYAERRLYAINYLGGKCIVCGTIEELEFDHKDPYTKTRSIDQCLMLTKYQLNRELDKCQLLCKKHHKEKSKKEQALQFCKRGHSRVGNTTKDGHCLTCKRSMNIVYKRRYNNKCRRGGTADSLLLKSNSPSGSVGANPTGGTNER